MEWGDRTIATFLDFFHQPMHLKGDGNEVAAACVWNIADPEKPIAPPKLFWATCTLWSWLRVSEFKDTLEVKFAEALGACWRRVIAKQEFALRQPMRTVPAIQAALDSSNTGLSKIAALALAAEDAVDYILPQEMRECLKNIGSA